MPNAPLPNTLSGEYPLANASSYDGLSGPMSNRPLLDWMSTEGLLEHVTCEANCE